jgi:hypothetical protein
MAFRLIGHSFCNVLEETAYRAFGYRKKLKKLPGGNKDADIRCREVHSEFSVRLRDGG